MTDGIDTGPKRIRAEAAAKLLNISVKTLYRWARDGRIPAKQVGRSWVFVREQLEAWLLESNNSQSTPRGSQGKG